MSFPFMMICYSMETELSFQLLLDKRSYTNYMKDTRVLLSVTCVQKNQFGDQGYLHDDINTYSQVIPAVEIS